MKWKKRKEKNILDKIDKEKFIEHNNLLMNPIKSHGNRKKFFINIENKKFTKNVKENIKANLFKGNIKNILYKMKIFKFLKDRMI